MSFTAEVAREVTVNGSTIRKIETVTASGKVSLSESVADSTTDGAIVVAIDVSEVKWFYLVADQDVTIETNDGTSPDDTISLTANKPYEWVTGDYDSFLLGTDVTVIYVTNNSGSTANIELEAGVDATPA